MSLHKFYIVPEAPIYAQTFEYKTTLRRSHLLVILLHWPPLPANNSSPPPPSPSQRHPHGKAS